MNIILLWAVLTTALTSALPNGYYHQEYNYKTHSSSYRNNELQHKNDDEGYYSKDGDLEGRSKPKINSHSEHSEYINPKLQNQYSTGYHSGLNGETNSYGNMHAQQYASSNYGSANYGSNYGHGYSDGLASSDNVQSNYGLAQLGHGRSYGISSDLRVVAQRLQSDMARQLQEAVHGYGRNYAIQDLEEELKRNLSRSMQEAIQNQYGQQSIRGGYSYSIRGGRVQPSANYDNQELTDLTRQMENNLIGQLRSQYRHSSSSSSQYSNYQYSTTTYRPYSSLYPTLYTTTVRPGMYGSSSYVQSNQQSHISYTPIPNPESLTSIASRVQSELNDKLNSILRETQSRYFSSRNSYDSTNINEVLARLQQELRSNITYHLDNEIRRNYGNQLSRDGYMYSIGPNGQYSAQSNYNIRDLENLKRQVESHLLDRLNRDFETYRTRYSSYGSSSYGSSSNFASSSNYGSSYGSTGSYDHENYSTRPTSSHMLPLISQTQGTKNSYSGAYASGASASGYNYGSSGSISQMQQQLQQDLSRQLQAALSRNQYRYSSSSGYSGSYNPQDSYQQLSEELSRNLTRQLNDMMSGYSGSSYNSQQWSDMRSQLMGDLQRQLQQGLQQQQSFSASSSYSARSSSSNYRPVRAFDTSLLQGGQFRTGIVEGEDCQYRRKRNIEDLGMTQQIEVDQFGRVSSSTGSNGKYTPERMMRNGYRGNSNSYIFNDNARNYDNDNDGLTQQVEEDNFGKIESLGQVEENWGQQIEDEDFDNLEISPSRIVHSQVQNEDLNADLSQREENYGKLELESNQKLVGQQEDDSDITQHVESEPSYSPVLISQVNAQEDHSDYRNNYATQAQEAADLTQQIEEDDFANLELGQETEQPAAEPPFARLHYNHLGDQRREARSHNYNSYYSQVNKLTDQDLTQQVEEDPFEKPNLRSQYSSNQDYQSNIHRMTYGGNDDYYQRPKPVQVNQNLDQQLQVDGLEVSNNNNNDDLVQRVEDPFKPTPRSVISSTPGGYVNLEQIGVTSATSPPRHNFVRHRNTYEQFEGNSGHFITNKPSYSQVLSGRTATSTSTSTSTTTETNKRNLSQAEEEAEQLIQSLRNFRDRQTGQTNSYGEGRYQASFRPSLNTEQRLEEREQRVEGLNNKRVNYGSVNAINEETVEPLKPNTLDFERASVVEPLNPNKNCKGGIDCKLNTLELNEIAETESFSSTTEVIVETTTVAQSWWSNLGNKIKSGAKAIKDKITG